jgi:hypothetical protein
MKRFSFTLNENGHLIRISADPQVEVHIVQPSTTRDRVYRWSSLAMGTAAVEEIGGWPVGDKDHFPAQH